jgi:hypothetical protein
VVAWVQAPVARLSFAFGIESLIPESCDEYTKEMYLCKACYDRQHDVAEATFGGENHSGWPEFRAYTSFESNYFYELNGPAFADTVAARPAKRQKIETSSESTKSAKTSKKAKSVPTKSDAVAAYLVDSSPKSVAVLGDTFKFLLKDALKAQGGHLLLLTASLHNQAHIMAGILLHVITSIPIILAGKFNRNLTFDGKKQGG